MLAPTEVNCKVNILKKLLFLVVAIVLILTVIWAWDRYQDHRVAIKVDSETALYASEEDAAYRLHKPIKIIGPAEKVKVKRTTYGKDYWALYIEANDGSQGWVDSGQPGIIIVRRK